jgi:CRP-like cAMP-binding protein
MQTISANRETEDGLLRSTGLGRLTFLSQEERRALEGAVISPRSVNAHTDLVREGERTDHLFLTIKGWACRYTTTREGGRQFSALLVPGDLCNLDSLLFDRLDCGVRTLTPATIVALPRESALALAEQHPGIARMFTWLAFVENAILGRLALTLGRRSAKERLAHLLCELSARLDMGHGDESSFEFPLTQEQIGDALGLTAVHVNRTMHTLRAEGLVAIASRTMSLLSVAELRQIGGFNPSYLHIEQAEAGSTNRVDTPKSAVASAISFSHLGA